MEIPRKLEVPVAVCEIARRLEDRGFRTWAVGGAVRDALLGSNRYDWDLATAARPQVVRKLFRPSYPIGIQFGTVGVRGSDGLVYEVTTFRRDVETDGRHAVVEYADELDEDLARRDFTINAIAYHPLEHSFHDPHGGREDLNKRLLRCVGDPATRFAEDYLRVLRGLRFAGRYRLEIDAATWAALTAAVPSLPRLSGERIREELLKILEGPAASSSLALYRSAGAVDLVFPELAVRDGDAWESLLRAIDSIARTRVALRLAALFRSAGNEVEAMMTRLRFSNSEVRSVVELGRAVAVPLPEPADTVSARRWLRDVGPGRARDVLRLRLAEARGGGASAQARSALAAGARLVLNVMRRHDPVTIADLAIDGHDLRELGLSPGPEFGRILEGCLDAVIENPQLNQHEKLLEYVRSQLPEPDGRPDRGAPS